MKRNLLIALMLCAAWPAAQSQTYDTVYCRDPECYYHEWYDECPFFYRDSNLFCLTQHPHFVFSQACRYAIPIRAPQPVKVRGLAAMVAIDSTVEMFSCRQGDYLNSIGSGYIPEYLELYRFDGVFLPCEVCNELDSLELIASVRWDTATPEIVKLPRSNDTAQWGFHYCYLYKAYFDSAITMDTLFYIGGTSFGNERVGYWDDRLKNKPVLYSEIEHSPFRSNSYSYYCDNRRRCEYKNPNYIHWNRTPGQIGCYGPFFPILDSSSHLRVSVNNPEMGWVTGGGNFPDSTLRTIEAMPYHPYKFVQWNDGVTDNPRSVFLTRDTLFTALLTEKTRFLVSVSSTDRSRGYVEGGGYCLEGDTATLTAIPYEGFLFNRWTDGENDSVRRSNPRKLAVTSDTSCTATFKGPDGVDAPGAPDNLFDLRPNPTHGTVTVTTRHASSATLTLRNAAGQEVLHHTAKRQAFSIDVDKLPAGVYFATLVTPQGTATRKLVIE